jgi:hypothetical protein
LGRLLLGHHFRPSLGVTFSWKGMRVSPDEERYGHPHAHFFESIGAYVEIDFLNEKAGAIAVDRNSFVLSEEGTQARDSILKIAKEMIHSFVRQNEDSEYAVLNARVAGLNDLSINAPKWIATRDENDSAVWQEVSFPTCTIYPWLYSNIPKKALFKGKVLQLLTGIRSPDDDVYHRGLSFISRHTPPDKIVFVERSWRVTVAPIWTKNPFQSVDQNRDILTCEFPPEWRSVIGVRFTKYADDESAAVWNKDHALVQNCTTEAWHFVGEASIPEDVREFAKAHLNTSARASAFLMSLTSTSRGYSSDVWQGFKDRFADVLRDLWGLAFGATKNQFRPILIWVEDSSDSRLRYITPESWDVFKETRDILKHMPIPSRSWIVEVPEERAHNPFAPTLMPKIESQAKSSTKQKTTEVQRQKAQRRNLRQRK